MEIIIQEVKDSPFNAVIILWVAHDDGVVQEQQQQQYAKRRRSNARRWLGNDSSSHLLAGYGKLMSFDAPRWLSIYTVLSLSTDSSIANNNIVEMVANSIKTLYQQEDIINCVSRMSFLFVCTLSISSLLFFFPSSECSYQIYSRT